MELNVGFGTNIDLKYKEMFKSLENKFEKVDFINLSTGALGIVGVHRNVTNMLKALSFQQQETAYLIKKIMYVLLYKRNVLHILYEE